MALVTKQLNKTPTKSGNSLMKAHTWYKTGEINILRYTASGNLSSIMYEYSLWLK